MSTLLPLLAGLVIFLGSHVLVRMAGRRARLVERFGPDLYRGLFSLVALLGLALIVYGFGVYRMAGYIPVWQPPRFLNHLAIVLIWPAMILLVAAYLPGRLKAKAKHPMLLAVKIWATGHLIANGDLGSIILFASFLGWAVWARIQLKRAGDPGALALDALPPAAARNDLIAIGAGSALAAFFVGYLHKALIGVAIL